jgi:hypothetical protein
VLAWCGRCSEGWDYWSRFSAALLAGVRADVQPDPERLRQARSRPQPRFEATATYEYRATDGTPLVKYRGSEHDPETGEVVDPKSFRWSHWSGSAWCQHLGGLLPRLYDPADAIGKASAPGAVLYVVEGEKDCDRLLDVDALAVSPCHGSNPWRREWTDELAAVPSILVVADDDPKGREHAREVAPPCPPRSGRCRCCWLRRAATTSATTWTPGTG